MLLPSSSCAAAFSFLSPASSEEPSSSSSSLFSSSSGAPKGFLAGWDLMVAPEPNAPPNPIPLDDDDDDPKAEPEPNPEAALFAPKVPKGLAVLGLAPPRLPNGDPVDPDSAPNFELAKRLDDDEEDDELPLDPKILMPEPAAVANGDLAEEFANPLLSSSCTRGTNHFVST